MNVRCAFYLVFVTRRLQLILSMPLIKLIFYENDVKLLHLIEGLYRSICDMFEV